MNTQQLDRADYLDILFDGRNKTYGAFELRRHYARRTRRALGVVLGISCIIAAYPLFAARNVVAMRGGIVTVKPTDIHLPPPPAKKTDVPRTQQAPRPAVTSLPKIDFKEMKIVPDAAVIKPPVIIDSLKGKIVSSDTADGQPGGTGNDLGPKAGIDGPLSIGLPTGNRRDPREIVETVDQRPEFKGDLALWLSNHLDYPARAQEDGLQGSVMMQFVVNEDGSISDVTTLSGAGHGFDAEAARVIKMMPNWKPAKLNGEAVRTWFKLPVVFALADN